MRVLAAAFLLIATPVLGQQQPSTGAEAVARGKTLYDQHCTACHGPNAGAGERAPAIVSAATSMRGQRSIPQLMTIIKNGIPAGGMPAWGNQLPDADIAAIGGFIQSLRGTAIDNPLPGDVAHGEAVFWGKGGCGSCHAIAGRGSPVGPDLTNIAVARKSTAISDALTKVEHRVFGDGGVHLPSPPPMDYEAVQVVTKSGRTIDGLLRNQDAWSVQFTGMDGKHYSLARADLAKVTLKPSVMPTDYDKRLTPDEFRDLMAFLTRQGTKIEVTEERRR
jgi:putative heme-binding domain-containing protein